MDDQNTGRSEYFNISSHLASLSDKEFLHLLNQGSFVHSNWGATAKIKLNGIQVFVKMLPLNEIEGRIRIFFLQKMYSIYPSTTNMEWVLGDLMPGGN